MASHHQRIYPAHDVEAPQRPSAPLVPGNAAKSDHGDPTDNRLPPPPRRAFPVTHSKPPQKRRSCCCRFICCIFSTILILTVAIAITIGALYLVFRPKLPKYSVDELRISEFNFTGTNTLSVTFNVKVTATNPNKKIGIYYESGSQISAWYSDTKLCEGSLPKFYQGHRNITVLNLPLTGETEDATGLENKLQEQVQDSGNIPLNIKVKQNVRIKLGKLKLFKVKFRVRCRVVVDSLSANNDIRISGGSCKFRFRL